MGRGINKLTILKYILIFLRVDNIEGISIALQEKIGNIKEGKDKIYIRL